MRYQKRPYQKASKLAEGEIAGLGHIEKKRKDYRYEETKEQAIFCKYLKLQGVMFTTHKAEGKRPLWEQKQNKVLNSGASFPDMNIRLASCGMHGLELEFKAIGAKITMADGITLKDKHHSNQYERICQLWDNGYAAYFVIGIDDAIRIFDAYKAGNLPPKQVFRMHKSHWSENVK